MTITEYRDMRKEQKKELMKWSKGDLADRLLFAYGTIQNLEKNNDTLRAEAKAEALREAADRIESWWLDPKTELSLSTNENIKQLRAAITGEPPKGD